MALCMFNSFSKAVEFQTVASFGVFIEFVD